MASGRLLVHRAALALSVALLASATPELAGGPAARIRPPGGAAADGATTDGAIRPGGSAGDGTGATGGDRAPSGPRAPRASRDDPLYRAALTDDDVGAGWSEFDPSGISGDYVVRIGGEVGVDNAPGEIRRYVEVGFERSDDEAAYVSNTVLLMADNVDARGVMDALRAAADITEWTQRSSDGRDDFRLSPLEFESVGDDTFAVRLDITTTGGPFATVTTEQADYVVFRIGPAVSFLFLSKVDSTEMAARSADRVRELVESA